MKPTDSQSGLRKIEEDNGGTIAKELTKLEGQIGHLKIREKVETEKSIREPSHCSSLRERAKRTEKAKKAFGNTRTELH